MQPRSKVSKAVIATILYSDIFDFPLSKEEVWKYLIQSKNDIPLGKKQVFAFLERGTPNLAGNTQYFSLKKRDFLFQLRKKRETISEQKIQIAKRMTWLIYIIPTIQLAGVSGSVSIQNASEEDDIDFFIICKSRTVWLTRLLLVCVLQVAGVRRKRFDKKTRNKICLNMFIDETVLSVPSEKQNLYTAHEVIQMKPLVNRKGTYERFLIANSWVKNFLPNALGEGKVRYTSLSRERINVEVTVIKSIRWFLQSSLRIAETVAKRIQLIYMRQYKTSEITTDAMLIFHPNDQGNNILQTFQMRLKKINE